MRKGFLLSYKWKTMAIKLAHVSFFPFYNLKVTQVFPIKCIQVGNPRVCKKPTVGTTIKYPISNIIEFTKSTDGIWEWECQAE